jgi:uridine kinase
MILLGIAGAARAGKDTLAQAIAYALPNTIKMSFAHAVKLEADPICQERHHISAFTEDLAEKKIIRYILIDVGHTRRQTHPTFWIDRLSDKIDAALPTSNVVITDTRYANEAEMIHSKGGIVIFVQRDAQATIPTEQESLPGIKWDIKLDFGNFNALNLLRAMLPGIKLA